MKSNLLYLIVTINLFLIILVRSSSADDIIVSTKLGQIKGFADISKNKKTFHSFLGIPYAESPIGELRYKEPQPIEPWTDVFDGTIEPHPCSQLDLLKLLREWQPRHVGNEDCLMLNVFSRKVSDDASKLPVIVFIHGGAFTTGGASLYEANQFMNEDIVLVVIQYRLGLLGFLSTEDSVIPSNLGLKDQSLALNWIKMNIDAFGGDPDRITLFGSSAGSASVHAHLLSRYSDGLFSRAIMQSGSLLSPWARTSGVRKTAMQVGQHFKCFEEHPNVDGKEKSELLLKCLKEINAKDLQLSSFQFYVWGIFPAAAVPHDNDGDFFPDNVETLMREGKMKDVDVIYGLTKDEGTFISNTWLVLDEQRKAIKDNFTVVGPVSLGLQEEDKAEDITRKVFKYYVGGVSNDIKDFEALTKMYGDIHFGLPTDWTALTHSKVNEANGKNTFFYEHHHRGSKTYSVLWGSPFPSKTWVCHCDDLEYVLPIKFLKNIKTTQLDGRMNHIYTKMFANFAATGNPMSPGFLDFNWTPFDSSSRDHLKIIPTPLMESDFRGKERKFWESLPTMQNRLLFGDGRSKDKKSTTKDEF